jgi:hypothetical protein
MKIRPAEAATRPFPVAAPSSPHRALPTTARPPAGTQPGASRGAESPFARMLGKMGKEIDRGERTMGAALSGSKVHDPGALLALQAGIYRYVEAVDLASKLIDRAAGAVKTTLQSQ